MANFGSSAIHILIAMAMAMLFCASAAMAQTIAPSPPMDAGVGFALPVSETLICSSLLFSLVAVFLH
ncbi:hypothetical protein CsSME_00039525 [Camellia sinensis var. sinensis]|uniref:Uncharacterized protein n=1 Tax=Camellia sinensis TaxID=4442 RepID=A0A7J7GN31_CAMSI|nr:hypothetical protein HYC85_022458 [Camellia sinensis]